MGHARNALSRDCCTESKRENHAIRSRGGICPFRVYRASVLFPFFFFFFIFIVEQRFTNVDNWTLNYKRNCVSGILLVATPHFFFLSQTHSGIANLAFEIWDQLRIESNYWKFRVFRRNEKDYKKNQRWKNDRVNININFASRDLW